MPRKYIASYEKMARKRGNMDPLQYIWEQYESFRKQGKHKQALDLAEMLVPYGHSKKAPKADDGSTVVPAVFVLK